MATCVNGHQQVVGKPEGPGAPPPSLPRHRHRTAGASTAWSRGPGALRPGQHHRQADRSPGPAVTNVANWVASEDTHSALPLWDVGSSKPRGRQGWFLLGAAVGRLLQACPSRGWRRLTLGALTSKPHPCSLHACPVVPRPSSRSRPHGASPLWVPVSASPPRRTPVVSGEGPPLRRDSPPPIASAAAVSKGGQVPRFRGPGLEHVLLGARSNPQPPAGARGPGQCPTVRTPPGAPPRAAAPPAWPLVACPGVRVPRCGATAWPCRVPQGPPLCLRWVAGAWRPRRELLLGGGDRPRRGRPLVRGHRAEGDGGDLNQALWLCASPPGFPSALTVVPSGAVAQARPLQPQRSRPHGSGGRRSQVKSGSFGDRPGPTSCFVGVRCCCVFGARGPKRGAAV